MPRCLVLAALLSGGGGLLSSAALLPPVSAAPDAVAAAPDSINSLAHWWMSQIGVHNNPCRATGVAGEQLCLAAEASVSEQLSIGDALRSRLGVAAAEAEVI
eukprot:SAG31_NODE_8686_length_1406_cov_1.080337_2_plen_102_part_00